MHQKIDKPRIQDYDHYNHYNSRSDIPQKNDFLAIKYYKTPLIGLYRYSP